MSSGTTEAARLTLSSAELKELASTVLYRHFGVQFSFHFPSADAPDPLCGDSPGNQSQAEPIESIARQCSAEARVVVKAISERLQALAIPLRTANRVDLVAIGIFASKPPIGPVNNDDALYR